MQNIDAVSLALCWLVFAVIILALDEVRLLRMGRDEWESLASDQNKTINEFIAFYRKQEQKQEH